MNNISLLILAADSGEGQFTRLIDPLLKEQLIEAGIHVCECFVSQLQKDDLALFDVVLLMRFPVPDHPQNDHADFQEKSLWLKEFVKQGGGLVMMFSECYGKTINAMNQFANEFDVQFAFNRLVDSSSDSVNTLPNMPEGKLIKCKIETDNQVTVNSGVLNVIVEGGHGSQHLTCLPGNDWQTLIRGCRGIISEPWADNQYAGTIDQKIESPVLGASRVYGNGRVVAFPGNSSFWITNPYLKRWQGYLLKQHDGAGLELLKKMVTFVAGNSDDDRWKQAENSFADRRLVEPEKFSFRYVNESEQLQLQTLVPYKMWIGFVPAGVDCRIFAERAKQQGYNIMVMLHVYDQLDKAGWQNLRGQYEKLGTELDMLIVPGFEQLDGEGNRCIVFNVTDLPDMRHQYPCSNMLEDLLVKLNGYTAIYATPEENRMPCWKQGGYNFMEISNELTVGYLRDRIASRAFVSGMVIDREGELNVDSWTNWVLADSCDNAMLGITENQHRNFVSSGPMLKTFSLCGPKLIEDDWEGYWYEWDAGDVAELVIDITDECELTEVVLWDGEEVFMQLTPNAKQFRQRVEIRLEKDLNLHVTAENCKGQTLVASYPVYTRQRLFWAHMGSDQMNDYHNVFVEDSRGCFGVGDKCYESYGFVTCGFAWGDYVRITPPVLWSDIMPQGLEISSLVCNFQDFHPSPFLKTEDGFEFLNMHKRKLGQCDTDCHVVHSTSNSSWLENVNGEEWRNSRNQVFIPTRIEHKSEVLRSDAEYRIAIWSPGQSCTVSVEQKLHWMKAFQFEEGQTISFNHSCHVKKMGLLLECASAKVALDQLLVDAPEVREQGEKEWDNLDMPSLLKGAIYDQKIFIVPAGETMMLNGDDQGTMCFLHNQNNGKVIVRGWQRSDNTFVLSYDLLLDQRGMKQGEVTDISYDISVLA
jgi:hypothetical protein